MVDVRSLVLPGSTRAQRYYEALTRCVQTLFSLFSHTSHKSKAMDLLDGRRRRRILSLHPSVRMMDDDNEEATALPMPIFFDRPPSTEDEYNVIETTRDSSTARQFFPTASFLCDHSSSIAIRASKQEQEDEATSTIVIPNNTHQENKLHDLTKSNEQDELGVKVPAQQNEAVMPSIVSNEVLDADPRHPFSSAMKTILDESVDQNTALHPIVQDDDEDCLLMEESRSMILASDPVHLQNDYCGQRFASRFLIEEDRNNASSFESDLDQGDISTSDEESPSEDGIIAVGIPARPVTPDGMNQYAGRRDEEEKEEERPTQTEDDAHQEAVSAVIAMNMAESEHNKKKSTQKNADDSSLPMIAMVRIPTTDIMALKETSSYASSADLSRTKSADSSISFYQHSSSPLNRSTGDFSMKSTESMMISKKEPLSLASPLPSKCELTQDDSERSPAFFIGVRNDRGPLYQAFMSGENSSDEDHELEAQAGIPVVLPGAFAMIGVDNTFGRQVTGYDSGFDDGDESDGASSGILEPPPLPEEERFSDDQEEPGADASSQLSFDILEMTILQAELHEEQELLFVDGQVWNEAEMNGTRRVPVVSSKTRIFQSLVVAIVAATAVTVVAVVTTSHYKKRGSNLRAGDGVSTAIGPKGWDRVGGDLIGTTNDNQNFFGQSISLSSSGLRLAVGVPGFDASIREIKVGQARLFDWNGETWDLIQSINGPGAGAEGGSSVALSSDGRRTVVGAPFWADGIGQVAVYEEQPTDGMGDHEWIQVGQPILAGNLTGDSPAFGTSVAVSRDGTILAVAAPYAQSTDGVLVNAGVVRVYQEKNSVWTQIGSDLEGEVTSGVFGTSIALSTNGMRIAVGSPSGSGSKSGLVQVFDFERSEWTSVGHILTASDDSTANYGFSVSLSDDGSILAVGALGQQQALSSGVVQVYRMLEGQWVELGKAMSGTNPSDHFGKSVALSAGGETIAIGSPRADGVVVGTGTVTVLKYNGRSWIQEQGVISGTSNGDALGSAVAISGLGKVIAGGAPNYNFDGVQSNVGKVQIYRSTAGVS
jgi:hypothetical protein